MSWCDLQRPERAVQRSALRLCGASVRVRLCGARGSTQAAHRSQRRNLRRAVAHLLQDLFCRFAQLL